MKSKQTLMKEISLETKMDVMARQGNRSISGVYLPSIESADFHHVVSRGQGGVGLAFNIVALTPMEHRLLHDHNDIPVNGRKRYTWMEFTILIKNHMKLNYYDWREEYCKYHKMWSVEDYWEKVGEPCSGKKYR